MLRKSIVFTSAILLVIIASSTIASAWLLTRTTEKRTSQYYVGTNNLYSVDEGWIRSNKKDGIETFYRYEKIGTDKFEVEVKIANYRSKAVKVSVQVQYKSLGGIRVPSGIVDHYNTQVTQSSLQSFDSCEIIVPSGISRICKPIKITAKKITGVKIIRWDNTN